MSTNVRATHALDETPDGSGRSVAIIASRFNDAIVENLVDGARRCLLSCGVSENSIDVVWAPGALEIPQVARIVAGTGRYDAVVALGAVIRGDTYHFEVVCDQSAAGLMAVALAGDVVVTNGILTVYDVDQAHVRSAADERNKGHEAALAALQTLVAIERLG